MACYTALFSTCRVTPTQNARSAALRLAVPALAARPVPTRALYSTRLSGPKVGQGHAAARACTVDLKIIELKVCF